MIQKLYILSVLRHGVNAMRALSIYPPRRDANWASATCSGRQDRTRDKETEQSFVANCYIYQFMPIRRRRS